MNKQKYYVSITTGEISQIPYGNNDDFVIHATMDEVNLLRAKMNRMNDADFSSFIRAHVPIKPYHKDNPNDDYDEALTEAYQMVYDLGDHETKSNLKQMNVFGDRHM